MRQSDANTVKIRDSALGLSGFVSFFWWAYLRGGAYPRRMYSYVLWAYYDKLTFSGEPIYGGGHYHGFLRCTRGVTILLENMVIGSHYILVYGTWQSLYTGIY